MKKQTVLNLSFLTDEERERISEVLKRDESIQKLEDARVRRLQNKARRTNNLTIKKKIMLRTGEWFWDVAEKEGGLKRNTTGSATVRASLRFPKKDSRKSNSSKGGTSEWSGTPSCQEGSQKNVYGDSRPRLSTDPIPMDDSRDMVGRSSYFGGSSDNLDGQDDDPQSVLSLNFTFELIQKTLNNDGEVIDEKIVEMATVNYDTSSQKLEKIVEEREVSPAKVGTKSAESDHSSSSDNEDSTARVIIEIVPDTTPSENGSDIPSANQENYKDNHKNTRDPPGEGPEESSSSVKHSSVISSSVSQSSTTSSDTHESHHGDVPGKEMSVHLHHPTVDQGLSSNRDTAVGYTAEQSHEQEHEDRNQLSRDTICVDTFDKKEPQDIGVVSSSSSESDATESNEEEEDIDELAREAAQQKQLQVAMDIKQLENDTNLPKVLLNGVSLNQMNTPHTDENTVTESSDARSNPSSFSQDVSNNSGRSRAVGVQNESLPNENDQQRKDEERNTAAFELERYSLSSFEVDECHSTAFDESYLRNLQEIAFEVNPKVNDSHSEVYLVNSSSHEGYQASSLHYDGIQASSSHSDDIQVSSSHSDNIQVSPSHSDDVQASSSHSDDNQSPPHSDDIQVSPLHSDDIQASSFHCDIQVSPPYFDDIHVSPSQSDDIQASSPHSDDIQASSSHSGDVQFSPLHSDDVQFSPSQSDDIQVSPLHSDDIQASLSHSDDVQASLSHSDDIQVSPPHSDDIQVSPPHFDGIQVSPLQFDGIQVSPLPSDDIQASSSHSDDVQASPSHSDEGQVVTPQSDSFQREPPQTDADSINQFQSENDRIRHTKNMLKRFRKGSTGSSHSVAVAYSDAPSQDNKSQSQQSYQQIYDDSIQAEPACSQESHFEQSQINAEKSISQLNEPDAPPSPVRHSHKAPGMPGRIPSLEVDDSNVKETKPGKERMSSESFSDSDKVEELSSSINFLQTVGRGSKKGSLGRSTPNLSSSLKLKPQFGSSWSVHSTASGAIRSDIEITGWIELSFNYSHKTGTLDIKVWNCDNLAAVDKKKLSNPYVKTYLLPDKHSKRKTRAKKKTINPQYNETLKYVISESELQTRTLNVAVWHDKIGVNIFLGEVNIDMGMFDSKAPDTKKKYYLEPKVDSSKDAFDRYLGEIDIALRLNVHGQNMNSPNAEGELEIVLKGIKNVAFSKNDNSSEVYVKSYFLPDKAHATKQKTPLMIGKDKISFDHLFMYTDVRAQELDERCLELTVWQKEKFGANRLIGGVRIGCGNGMSFDTPVPWMDSNLEEMDVWKRMKNHPESWVDGHINLRMLVPAK